MAGRRHPHKIEHEYRSFNIDGFAKSPNKCCHIHHVVVNSLNVTIYSTLNFKFGLFTKPSTLGDEKKRQGRETIRNRAIPREKCVTAFAGRMGDAEEKKWGGCARIPMDDGEWIKREWQPRVPRLNSTCRKHPRYLSAKEMGSFRTADGRRERPRARFFSPALGDDPRNRLRVPPWPFGMLFVESRDPSMRRHARF